MRARKALRMTREEIQQEIEKQWDNPSAKMDWLKMEALIRMVYDTLQTPDEKLFQIREILAAFTGRG